MIFAGTYIRSNTNYPRKKLRFIAPFGFADLECKSVFVELNITVVKGNQFGTPERTEEPHQEQSAICNILWCVSRRSRSAPTRSARRPRTRWATRCSHSLSGRCLSCMRLDEICGLRTEDVAEESGILFFDIVSHEGRRVKTAASRRRVPVHSELLRMGFDEYLANIQRQRHQYLFPALKPGGPDKKRSWYIGKRFTQYRRSVGVSDPNTTFHCLRKNTATALERARIPENEAVQILGHKKMTMSYGLYSSGLDLNGLRHAVEAIQYHDLGLAHLCTKVEAGLA